LGGDVLDDGSVDPFLILVKIGKNFIHDVSWTFTEDFMTPHGYQAGRIHGIIVASSRKTDVI
jgi:hypothetical protein